MNCLACATPAAPPARRSHSSPPCRRASFRFTASRRLLGGLLLATGLAGAVHAEVTRVEITRRTDLDGTRYEKLTGTLHFAIDPKLPVNAVIADVDRAPRNARGQVEFSADFYVLKPRDPKTGNGAALVEVSNRGGRSTVTSFNLGGARDPQSAADLGDRFLLDEGYTLVWVGWEFDVPRAPGVMRLEVPAATDAGRTITGFVRSRFVPEPGASTHALTDLAAYPPSDPSHARAELFRLESPRTPAKSPVPRAQWQLRDGTVTLAGGFAAGQAYEIAYEAANPPVAGLGFAALRDATAWLRHRPDSVAPVRHAYTFGSSQSGRFLRAYLYHGFNTDEQDRPVFDGVIAHIAGAARINFNRRWSAPRELGLYTATEFPFSDLAQADPISGASEGLLENPRVRHRPRIFYTNTSVEYWGGGRSAALVHTDPAGTRDAALPDHVRFYAFAGTQHGPASISSGVPALGQERPNPTNFWYTLRALLPALHRWVSAGTPPPPSAYPTFRAGTLVPAAAVAFPALPGVASPRALTAGLRNPNPLLAGDSAAPLPLLVSQVDEDGNELGGIRLPEIAVPLGTHTGWNFRRPGAGAPGELVPLIGSWIPFPATRAARAAARDPRRSLEERYASRDDYVARYEAAAQALVTQGYLLASDLPRQRQRALELWAAATSGRAADAAPRKKKSDR